MTDQFITVFSITLLIIAGISIGALLFQYFSARIDDCCKPAGKSKRNIIRKFDSKDETRPPTEV